MEAFSDILSYIRLSIHTLVYHTLREDKKEMSIDDVNSCKMVAGSNNEIFRTC